MELGNDAVMSRLRVASGQAGLADGFELGFVDADGVERREPLGSAVEVAFEAVAPVRSFPSYRGQRHYPGLWWSSTTGEHVGFESWLERDEAMLLDFDPQGLGSRRSRSGCAGRTTATKSARTYQTISPG